MTDWFRSWHGAPTDPKWLGIARRANVAPGIAVAIAWALMDRASQAEDRGSIEGYDSEGLAYFFGCEPDQVDAIVVAMTDKGMIIGSRYVDWVVHQSSSDASLRLPPNRWAILRDKVFERDGYACQYCGRRGERLECDHVVPVSRGGSHEMENLLTACFSCNRQKGAKTVEEWLS